LARATGMTAEDHKANPNIPEFEVELDPGRAHASIDMSLQTKGFVHILGQGVLYDEVMDFDTLRRTRVENCK
jgi:hypothetical protein